LAIEGATMVAMIDRLVLAGLVIREPSTRDRRIKHVVVTEAGRRLYDKVKLEADRVRKDLLATIGRHELQVATEVLEALQLKIEEFP